MRAWCRTAGLWGARRRLPVRALAEPARTRASRWRIRSLVKYRLIIDESGGWDYFQALLAALKAVADRHSVAIGTVAIRWVLDTTGRCRRDRGRTARTAPRHDARRAVLALDADDLARIAAVQASATGPAGEVYALERDRGGRHASIMRYDLQRT